jgi:hypothetical protein
VVDAIPERTGCSNPKGIATINAGLTSIAVAFPQTEAVAPHVYVTFVSESGGVAAAGSRMGWASGITTTGFTLNVPTAPGGAVVNTFAYRLELPS